MIAQGAVSETDIQVSDRLIYLNESLMGAYATCVRHGDDSLYLEGLFFERVKLQKLPDGLICEGRPFWKAKVKIERLDGKNIGRAHVSPSDYEPQAPRETSISSELRQTPLGSPINVYALQHETGFWFEQTKMTNITLGISGKKYSPFGLFTLDGYASNANGRSFGFLRDASWKRSFPEKRFTAKFGLNVVNNTGAATTLYGLVLESEEHRRPRDEVRSIQGFADVPGRIQIRARGVLIKEIPISAGYYSLPLSHLTSNASDNGQYALTLVDDSGREVRTWNEFIPVTPQLLPTGEANWKLFFGQIKNSTRSNNIRLTEINNIGTGFLYRYGINKYLTGELSTTLGKYSHARGLSFDLIPTAWLSIGAGQNRSIEKDFVNPKKNGYWGINLHSEHASWYSGLTQQSCPASNFPIGEESICRNIRHSLQVPAGRAGRLSFLRSSSIDSRPISSSFGFNWSVPVAKGWGISLYGTEQRTDNNRSFVLGLIATIALDKAHLMNSISLNNSDNHNAMRSYSTSYTNTANNETQYSMGADITKQPYGQSTTNINSSVNYYPWHGAYQANVRIKNDGSYSLGLNESGGLIFFDENIITTRTVENGLAVLRLKGLSNRTVEDNNGIVKSVTNQDGYAVIPMYGTNITPSLRVAAEEIPNNIKLPNVLVGRNPDPWTATYWEPEVKNVRQGWIRLIFKAGNVVPTGSVLNLGEHVYVLENGEVFLEDLPNDITSILVTIPRSRERCIVQLPADLELRPQYNATMSTLQCN